LRSFGEEKNEIKMKKAIYLNMLVSIFTLLLVPFLNIYAQTTPFFVMTPNDKDQYILTTNSWEYTSYITTKSMLQTSVDSMVIHDGIKFYRGYFISPEAFLGMDETNNKLYFLKDSNKYLMFDFNIPPGGSYTGYLSGIIAQTIAVSGTESVRGFSISFISPQGGSSTSYTVEKRIGFTQMVSSYTISNGRGFSRRFAPFDQVRFNQNGDMINKVENWAPKLAYTPELTTKVFLKTFDVNTTHDMNSQLAKYIPGINFNDSLLIQYFYTNGIDTTSTVVKGIVASTPITKFTLQLDSAKMKSGYKLKYRFSLKDKFYKPKQVFVPYSTGYNTLSCDSSLLSRPASPQNPVSMDLQAFPNPVSKNNNLGSRSATIRFKMPSTGYATGTLFDILGRTVVDILDGDFPAGENLVHVDATELPSGVYIFRLTTKSGSEHIKILVTK
jgi:hypothetical protein